jgi:hypothetical protein
MITAGDRGYGAWRDGGMTVHDISDRSAPKLLAHVNWSPPFAGGTHTTLPLPGATWWPSPKRPTRRSARRARSTRGWSTCACRRTRCRSPRCRRRAIATSAAIGTFGPHNLHENRPGSFQSEETLFATYNNAGVRVFDIRDAFAPKEIASWVPPTPAKLIDPRPNVALAAKTADVYVTTEGLMYVSDWNAGVHVLSTSDMHEGS